MSIAAAADLRVIPIRYKGSRPYEGAEDPVDHYTASGAFARLGGKVTVTEPRFPEDRRSAEASDNLGIIGRVIEKFAARNGLESVRDYTGHGVGPAFHTGLVIPHYDAAPYHADVIEVGMVFTVEPMLCMGSQANHEWDDGWTVVTDDGSWVAQFEHTIHITENGPEVLTLP